MTKEKNLKKHLQSFWSKELKSHQLTFLLSGVEKTNELNLFFNPDSLDAYPSNLSSFLELIENGFIVISRVRGKKHDAITCWKEIKAKSELYFSESGDLAGKRKRETADEDVSNKAKREHIGLSATEKALLRDLIGSIMKNPKSESFLYPVDKSVYPEYYVAITSPMDLTTWKKMIAEFDSLQNACGTLRLIWKNCLQFNLEGSEISEAALEIARTAEQFIAVNFGKKLADFSYLKSVKLGTQGKEIERTETDQKFLKELLDKLWKHELASPFLYPVRDQDAPGYSSIIDTPMDLTTIKRKLKAGSYSTLNEFTRDVNLIWENCIDYNDPKSEIVQAAKSFRSYFLRLIQLSDSSNEPQAKVQDSSKTDQIEAKIKEAPKSKQSKHFSEIVRSLKDFAPYIEPFILPVNEDDAPGYSDVIKTPMCVATVEEKIKSKDYTSNPSLFVRDIRMIWGNCKIYNLPDSQIYQWASKCEAFCEGLFSRYPELLENPSLKPVTTTAVTSNDEVGSTVVQGVKESIQGLGVSSSLEDELVEVEDYDLVDDDLKTRKIRPKISFRERKFRSILHQLATDEEVGRLFTFTSSEKSVGDKISYPNVREELKSYVDSPHRFIESITSRLQALAVVRPPVHPTEIVQSAIAKLYSLFNRSFPALAITQPEENHKSAGLLKSEANVNVKSCDSYLEMDEILNRVQAMLPDEFLSQATSIDSSIRVFASRKAAELLRQTKLPFIVKSGCYEVQSFGAIDLREQFHDSDIIYPLGYSNRSTIHLAVSDLSKKKVYPLPFVAVNIFSRIIPDDSGIRPVFQLSLENSVEISRSMDSPLSAWQLLVGKESLIVNAIGSRLKRCRAVFNRLCVSPDAEPFLEKVPLDDSIGVDYYRAISSPMWMREIHGRLVEGMYDNEYDFAWDVRLVFRNCMSYNTVDSALYQRAERLSAVFDGLLADWVYNVQDRSIEDLAKGTWEKWLYLKYFDEIDSKSHFCKATGQKARVGELLRCRWCEDQYLPSSIGMTQKPSRSSGWACDRCAEAFVQCENDLRKVPPPLNVESDYSVSKFGKNLYVPSPDIGPGWYQARRKGRGGLKNQFLSPLGYEVNSKEEIKLQMDFESVIDKELMMARAKEFKESLSESTPGHKKRKRNKRGNESDFKLDSDLVELFSVQHIEEGRIITGKLVDFELPENMKWSALIPSNEGNSTGYLQLDDNNFGSTGFFGLEIPAIRMRIEGLSNAPFCSNYEFLNIDNLREELQKEFEDQRQRVSLLHRAKSQVANLLITERWDWERRKNNFSWKIEKSVNPDFIHFGFKPLTFPGVEDSWLSMILVVWDFLATTQQLTGLVPISLLELTNSFYPPSSILQTIGQSTYDEVCSSVTELLLDNVSKCCEFEKAEWQEYLITHPLNAITWPKVAEVMLLVMSLPLNTDQSRLLMNSSLQGESLVQLKTFTLLLNHPASVIISTVPAAEAIFLELMEKLLVNAADSKLAMDTSKENFCQSIEEFFRKIELIADSENLKLACSVVSVWFRHLLGRLGYISTTSATSETAEVPFQPILKSWGGYVSRFYGSSSDDVLMPWSFEVEGSPYSARLQALLWLERSFSLLTSSDSESWGIYDRICVATTLVDYSRTTSRFLLANQQKLSFFRNKYGRLSVDDFLVTSSTCESVRLAIPKGTTCLFSGVEFDSLPDPNLWSLVPPELCHSLEVEQHKRNAANYSFRHNNYAIKSILQTFLRCKENAIKDRTVYEAKMKSALTRIMEGKSEEQSFSTEFLNSQSIGIDATGNSFWLLRAQESFPVFPIDSNGRSVGLDKAPISDPCLLMRSNTGTWMYHDISRLASLVQFYIGTDREFSFRLLERILSSKTAISSFLVVQPSQKLWLERKSYIEKWYNSTTLYTGASETHRCRQLEAVYARCGEARLCNYYSDFLRKDRPDHEKRIKEYQLFGSLDFNPIEGWLSDGLKRIASTCIATRIHSDPSIANSVVQNASKNHILRKWKTVNELKLFEEVVRGDEVGPVTDNNNNTQQQSEMALYGTETLAPTLTEYVENRLKESISSSNPRTKAILQIHPTNGSILRVYLSGKEAASFLHVSQSGISLCLNGLKPESYGFRWRWYEGLPIEYDLIQHLQTPLNDLRSLQVMRGKPVIHEIKEREHLSELRETSAPAEIVQKPSENNYSFPTVSQGRNQSHIISSTKTTTSKLIKLKSEIFNILYSFPEKALKWPELDSSSENMIQAAGESAFNNVIAASASILAVAQESGQAVDINKMAEKASRKARRRLRRKLALDIFTKAVQSATTPSDLLTQVIVLETAIPLALTYVCNRSGLPPVAYTCAEVALRLFSLDRSIAYDEIQGIENAALISPVKLRVCYSLRCHISGNCTRYLGHSGKCTLGAAAFSRLPDHFQIAPPSDNVQSVPAMPQQYTEVPRKVAPSQPPTKIQHRAVEEYLPRLASYKGREGVDIEMITPWLPASTDISSSQWI